MQFWEMTPEEFFADGEFVMHFGNALRGGSKFTRAELKTVREKAQADVVKSGTAAIGAAPQSRCEIRRTERARYTWRYWSAAGMNGMLRGLALKAARAAALDWIESETDVMGSESVEGTRRYIVLNALAAGKPVPARALVGLDNWPRRLRGVMLDGTAEAVIIAHLERLAE